MVEPVVTALGHAGLCVEAQGVRLLLDPWVSRSGAFLGSWFPFPDNEHLPGPWLADADLVVVSHEHLDHLDLDFLAQLPARVPIVVPRYPSTIIERRLAAAGRRHVIVLDAWERLRFGRDGWLTVIPEQCPMSHDAAVLVSVDGYSVLHTNDARISLAQTRRAMTEVGGPPSLMAVQMSGASWHPVCYDYPPDVLAEVSERKRVAKFRAVTRLVRSVKPTMVLPYAGPPCFLDPALFELNARLHGPDIFPDQHEALAWLRERLPDQRSDYLLPGDSVRLGSGGIRRDPNWSSFRLDHTVEERRRYLEAYAERRRAAIDAVWAANPVPAADSGLGEAFRTHLESLATLSSYFLARIGLLVRFRVLGPAGGTWDAHLGPDAVRVDLDGGRGPADYEITVDGRWLAGVVSGRTRWEELLLSLRISARREPDIYNDYLVGLLKHADLAALRAVEAFEAARDPEDTFLLEHNGRMLEVGRYCPHNGEDLTETGVVVDGTMHCLGHNFEFDLATGECRNARCDPLPVREVDPAYSCRSASPTTNSPVSTT